MEQGATNSAGEANMDCAQTLEEFISTGRTGRRNAMPDILDEHHASTGTGGIACGMEKLNCSDNTQSGDSSKSPANTPSGTGS